MYLNLQNNFSNVSYCNYLSSCDLLNKYNLTSSYHIPKLKNIQFELNLKDLSDVYEMPERIHLDPILQTKVFIALFFNFLTGVKPSVKATKVISSSKTKIYCFKLFS